MNRLQDILQLVPVSGADGHGVFRLPQYIRRIKAGGETVKQVPLRRWTNMPARGWSLALDKGTSDAAPTPPAWSPWSCRTCTPG